jgi:hypothetical protein
MAPETGVLVSDPGAILYNYGPAVAGRSVKIN